MDKYLKDRLQAVAGELECMHGQKFAQAFLDDYYAAKIVQSEQNETAMLTIDSVRPMLLDERRTAPMDQDGYLVEPKFDGYRVLAEFGEGKCQLRTKNGADCTRWFGEVVDALAGLKCGRTIVDGEMCVLDEVGRSDFDSVHARARRRRYTEGAPLVTYCIFDLLVEKGRDITGKPLKLRKAKLAKLLAQSPSHTLYVQHMSSEDVIDPVSWMYEHALQLKLEGVVGKRADSIYLPGARTTEWFKLKRPGAVPAKRFRRT